VSEIDQERAYRMQDAQAMRLRAERAEALLNNIVSDDRPFTTTVGDCAFCDVYLDIHEAHDPDCPIARARAHLEAQS
jgi:hypothetical protein